MLNAKSPRLQPLIKYPGGKERELKFILPALPEDAKDFFDPFVGAGAVYLAVDADGYFINDYSEELMLLYSCAKDGDELLFSTLYALCDAWDLLGEIADERRYELIGLYQFCARLLSQSNDIYGPLENFCGRMIKNFWPDFSEGSILHGWWKSLEWKDELIKSLLNKFKRMKALEEKKGMLSEEDCAKNTETCLKNAFYMYVRGIYNHALKTAVAPAARASLYFFIREYCYSSMFRFNSNSEFNVPYGGISYNSKSVRTKVDALRSKELADQLSKTVAGREDFESFLKKYPPRRGDFVFLDPPYDTTFSSYDGAAFTKEDHARLADWAINVCEARFLLIIKDTDFIRTLYEYGRLTRRGTPLHVYQFDKNYFVSFMARNDRRSKHMLITNYEIASTK